MKTSPAGGGDEEDGAARPGRLARSPGGPRCLAAISEDVIEGLPPHVGLHDHAGATAERGVVDGAVAVMRPVAQVVEAQIDEAVLSGAPDEGQIQDAEEGREDADDVDAHPTGGRGAHLSHGHRRRPWSPR
ncbi:hypothetical protein ADENT20671_1019 [Actinomyces denticolens]|nr:hypothetical protein ADENT20671_1019 [Actinomyces denticolens]